MTDHPDPDVHAVDQAGRAAARGLHAHVARQINPELILAAMPPVEPPRRHARFLAAAAVAALLIGSVAVIGDGPRGDDRSRLELDEDGNKLPAPTPGTLTPLGPNDGLDSIQLPVTVEPNVDLENGDTVAVSSSGFVPGEQVGIVQCAREAGGEVRERRAGIDGCTLGGVQYADADEEGVASGTYRVERVITTQATGTVDCALEAERCIVAMGAISDYDRSGGFALTFAGGGEPIDIPTVTVTPAEGLADGDLVHLEGEGFAPNVPLNLSVCSIDPQGCWSTGDEVEIDDGGDGGDEGVYSFIGLIADGSGRVSGDVSVWRFLPGGTPGSYIDCAVSTCSLRIMADGGYSPPPTALGFTAGGPGPKPPAVAVSPTDDLEPGEKIVVRGAGFEPGVYYSISLCAGPPEDPNSTYTCFGGRGGDAQIEEDGGFAILFEVPDGDDLGGVTATTMCAEGVDCAVPSGAPAVMCDGISAACTIRVEYYSEQSFGAPQFQPEPVVVTFRA